MSPNAEETAAHDGPATTAGPDVAKALSVPYLKAAQAASASASLNYADFTFTPVIDWVEVRVKLAGKTQPQHVRKRIERALPRWGKPPYVNAETDAPSRTADTINFRIQDPPSPSVLMRELQAVARPGDPPLTEQDIELIGIEIALDLTHKTHDREAMLAMAFHMLRHHAKTPAGTPRILEPKHYTSAGVVREIQQALAEGLTIRAGAVRTEKFTGDDYQTGYYFKTKDTLNGIAYAAMQPENHRARMEITLRGSKLPFTTLDGWRNYEFTELAPYFAMRCREPRPVDAPTLPDWVSIANEQYLLRLGRPLDEPTAADHRRGTKPRTKADADWNQKMRVSFRHLTRAQRRD